MPSSKEIRGRIKSVKNTGKITKAMELISTVKMKKAQEGVLGLRPFALAALEILKQVGTSTTSFGIYSEQFSETHDEIVVMVAAQKGLCGGYNMNVFKKTTEYVRDDDDAPFTREYFYVTVGKKARDFVLRTGQRLLFDFSDEYRDPVTYTEVRRLIRFLADEWKTGKYTKISIVYNHYVSAITQTPVQKTLFPIVRTDIDEFLAKVVSGYESREETPIEYTIEPSRDRILESVVPLILDVMIHETLLEARASEHAARMVAMKNAKDSANKKASALTLVYNKTRQAAITKEVSEIVSGVESMKEN